MPGLRIVARVDPAIARILVGIFFVAVVALVIVEQPDNPFRPSGDTWIYAAAGERLDAGHDLYAVGPDDRPVDLNPPYWTIPLVSPPPIAVLWRPLAAIGAPAWVAWWLAGILCSIAMVLWALAKGSAGAVLWILLVLPALTQATLSGNASAFLVPLLFLAWQLRDRAWIVGFIIGAAAAVKLSPVLLGLWLVRAKRGRATVALIVLGLVIAAGSVVGAGFNAWHEWLVAAPKATPAQTSLAGITGWPSLLVLFLVIGVSAALILYARSERVWFSVCVIASVAATPALYFTTFALLAAAASPFVMNWRSSSDVALAGSIETG